MSELERVETGLGEECGVFGAYDMDGGDVAPSVYYGLFALQHRGQESCGIAVTDTYGKRKVHFRKGLGLVNEVFDEEELGKLKGNLGVGHVRYSTAGGTRAENAQPLVLNYVKGTLVIAHNGNLTNAIELRHELEYTGAIFQTTIDSEVIAYHIARERLKVSKAEDAVKNAMKKIEGAYALVVSSPRKMIGARDPFGLKPLCIGKRDNTWFLASESCALAAVGADFIRDVEPGEIVSFTKHGVSSDKSMQIPLEKQARCIFEYIYFARPDSVIQGVTYGQRDRQHQCISCKDCCRKGSCTVLSGRGRSGCRCAGFRTGCGKRIFGIFRNPLRYGIPQEQLCRKNLYQAEAEPERVQCEDQTECY